MASFILEANDFDCSQTVTVNPFTGLLLDLTEPHRPIVLVFLLLLENERRKSTSASGTDTRLELFESAASAQFRHPGLEISRNGDLQLK